MFSPASILPLTPGLPLAGIAFHLPALGIVLLTAAASAAFFIIRRPQAAHQARGPLRLVPTANAWGYSERAQLDESAVGL